MTGLVKTSDIMARESGDNTKDVGKVPQISLKSTNTKHEHLPKVLLAQSARDLVYVNPRHVVHKYENELPLDSNSTNVNISEKVNLYNLTELKTSFHEQMINQVKNSVADVLEEESGSGSEVLSKLNHQFDEKHVNHKRIGTFGMLNALQSLKNPTTEANVQVDEGFNDENLEASNFSSHAGTPLTMGESIILQSLGPNISQIPHRVEPKLSKFGKSNKGELAVNDEQEVVEKTTSYNNEDEDYLDYSEYADYYNDPMEDSKDRVEDILEVIKFRDYPMGDGYVKIPVYVPGLEIVDVSEVPQLWSAREAFMRQVGSKLYMFIPSAILGFLIGLLIWILILACIRIFGAVKKTVARLFPSEKVDELDLKVMYAMSGDGNTWNKIRDDKMAKIHSVHGSVRRSGNCTYSMAYEDKLDKPVQEAVDYTFNAEQKQENVEKVLRYKEMEVDSEFKEQIIRSWRVIGSKDKQGTSH